MRSDNKSGFKGVQQRGSKFIARIWNGSKNLRIGIFDTPEEAHEAYKQKTVEMQGDFANA